MTEITGARLRQDFQNRIDGVRAKSVAVVSDAVRATKDARPPWLTVTWQQRRV